MLDFRGLGRTFGASSGGNKRRAWVIDYLQSYKKEKTSGTRSCSLSGQLALDDSMEYAWP